MRAPAHAVAPTFALVLALAAGSACDEDDAPTCRIKATSALPPGALGDNPNVRLEGAGARFVLSGWDAPRLEIRALTTDGAGSTGPELAVTLPEAPAAGPWHTAIARPTGELLLVVYGIAAPTQPGAIALRLITVATGTPPTTPVPLLDPEGQPVILPAPPPPGTVALGSAASGTNALFVAATAPTSAPVAFLITSDGTSQSLASFLPAPAGATTCLTLMPSRLAFAVSRVIPSTTPNVRPRWLFAEISEQGTIGNNFDFDVLSNDSACPVLSPTPFGYVAAWQNRVGTYFAEVRTGAAGISLDSGLLKGAVRFGGADSQPGLACIASGGHDVHITFASRPPSVERFTRFGIQAGGALAVPAGGQVGPVTAWPKSGSTFVTFLESPAGGGAPLRRVVEVECPGPGLDASAD
ncbi:MAG TPA: hypothetical protein VGG33_09900 [Polyangia bacterium]